MSSLLVIVPTRGRAQNVAALIDAWHKTGATASLELGMDSDDPTVEQVTAPLLGGHDHPWLSIVAGPPLGMCGTLNALAVENAYRYRHIGFMGDDHRPRTPQWDKRVRDTLDEMGTGICYGDDLVHGEGLPTAVFMTSDIIRALGYMAPPELQHLYLDNFWLTLGEELGAIRYLPDVVIEHMHPLAGKAPLDDGYKRVNAVSVQEHDRAVFEHWRDCQMREDVEKVRASAAVR